MSFCVRLKNNTPFWRWNYHLSSLGVQKHILVKSRYLQEWNTSANRLGDKGRFYFYELELKGVKLFYNVSMNHDTVYVINKIYLQFDCLQYLQFYLAQQPCFLHQRSRVRFFTLLLRNLQHRLYTFLNFKPPFVIRPISDGLFFQTGLSFQVRHRGLKVYLNVDYLLVPINQAFVIEATVINHDYYDEPVAVNINKYRIINYYPVTTFHRQVPISYFDAYGSLRTSLCKCDAKIFMTHAASINVNSGWVCALIY